jgi:thioredoxin-like negative regulator of GroEL
MLKKLDPAVPVAKIDAATVPDLVTQYKIQKFPYVLLFIDGKPIEYSGTRFS